MTLGLADALDGAGCGVSVRRTQQLQPGRGLEDAQRFGDGRGREREAEAMGKKKSGG